MPSFLWLSLFAAVLINIGVSQTVISSPTSGNLTHQYYINSEYTGSTNFQWDTINCATTYCHIICDEISGCYGMDVNAAASDTLILECLTQSSCETATVLSGPKTNLYIYCGDQKACATATINSPTTNNVNLTCNYTTTSSTSGSCYNMVFNASQSSTVSVDCLGYYTCYSADYYLNYAGSVTISADGQYTMRGTVLYAYNMKNELDITCGYYSCYSMTVHATDMQSSVAAHCNGAYGCRDAYFYCPTSDECNIDCTASDSCYNTQIYIPSVEYEGLNLECNPIFTDSCYTADIRCSDTGTSTALIWDATNSYFKCNTFGCCTVSEGNITCSPGSNCQITCNTENCRNHIINATLATGLTIDCTGSGCDGSTILCPTGDATSCSINCDGASCSYAAIKTGTDNTMSSFSLQCGYSSGCQYVALALAATSITDVSIDCSASYSCRYSLFSVASTISNDFNLTCSSTGCYYMNIDVPSSVNKLLWNCSSSSSCYLASMTFGQNAVVNTYELSCSASSSCYGIDIDANISNQANIICGGQSSCRSANVKLVSTTSDVNINIDCINPIPSTSTSYAACYSSYWYLHGYVDSNGDSNNNMTLQCSQRDCYSADIYGYNLYNADIDCDAPYSCQSADIFTASTDILDLSCNNDYACSSTDVYCPYRDEKSCKITCSEDTQTCYGMQVHVPSSYVYGYLDLTCPSEEIHPNSDGCVGLDVNCDGAKSQAQYVYNYTIHDYECRYDGTSYCCPYFKGTEIKCENGKNCAIDCSSSSNNCASALIDGTEATYLTLDCAAYDCQSSLIHCPVAGCSINCIGSYSCDLTTIAYNGELTDNGVVSVNCTGSNSCRYTVINVEYVNEFDISLNGRSGYSDYAGYYATINANYANKVVIDIAEQYSAYYTIWNVQYAKSVILTATGDYAMYYSDFKAADAGSVVVSLSANKNDWAARNGDWYIPQNTTINCYGMGCYYLYNLYRGTNTDSSGLQINVNSCGQCTGITGCIYDFQIYCDSGTDYFSSSAGCGSYNYCGCKDAVDNAQYSLTYTAGGCYSVLAVKTCKSGEDCVINCDYSSGSCASTVIDGSLATHLTVNCGYSSYCSNALITCPVAGCTINCDGSSVCYQAQIFYLGTEATQNAGSNGNVSVKCTGSSSCYYTEINAEYADNVDIECDDGTSSYSYICYYTTLHAQYANNVNLDFLGYRGSYYGTWNVNNASKVTLNAFGQYAFYYSDLYAQWAGSVDLKCSDEYYGACYNSEYYVPSNTTVACYGEGCNDLGSIYLATDASGLVINTFGCGECSTFSGCVGSFYLYCGYYGSSSYSNNVYCSPSSTYTSSDYCGCDDLRSDRMIYSEAANNEKCFVEPTPQPTTGEVFDLDCTSGSECNIDCGSSTCSRTLIDASIASYLTVTCSSSYDCDHTTIICPNAGCHIKCTGSYGCQYANIMYNGELNDGAEVKVDCSDNYACYYTGITANYADTVSLSCKSTEYGYDYTCYYLTLYAQHSNTVNLVGHYEYGFYQSYLYVNNATSVSLDAFGSYGFYNSYLYATNAGSVSVKCVAGDSETAACYSSDWYLPSSSGIYCYGPGCDGMGTFYVEDSSTLSDVAFNINACGDCDDKEDCLGSLTIQCGVGYAYSESYYGYSYTFGSSSGSCSGGTYGSCGCSDFIDSISFSDESSDDQCYSPSLSGAAIAGIVIGVIGGIICIILICYCIMRQDKKKRERLKQQPYVSPNVAKPVAVSPVATVNYEGAAAAQQTVQFTPYGATPYGAKQPVVVAKYVPNAAGVGNQPVVYKYVSGPVAANQGVVPSPNNNNNIEFAAIKSTPNNNDILAPPPGIDEPPSYNDCEQGAPPPAYGDIHKGDNGEGGATGFAE